MAKEGVTDSCHHYDAKPEQPSSAEQGIVLAPYFLMRVTGLPITTLDELCFPRTMALIEEILDIEVWLEERRDRLLDMLREHSELLPDTLLQHKCLDLRRAIAGLNGKRARKLLSILAGHLADVLVAETDAWCDRAIRRADLLASGEPTLQEELTSARRALRELLRDNDFQRGLLLSSPTLYTELQHYLSAPPHKVNNRLRRAEAGLLSYLVRMAAKTSPYSTFTSTAFGTWREQDSQDSNDQSPWELSIQDWQRRSVVRLHAGILDGIIRTLAKRQEIRPYLRPTLNTTIRWISNDMGCENGAHGTNGAKSRARGDETTQGIAKIEFFTYSRGDPRSRDQYYERLVRLRLGRIKLAIINEVARHDGLLTYRQLVDKVTIAIDKNGETDTIYEVTAALEYLLDCGALTIGFPIPEHEDDKLRALIDQLRSIPGSWVSTIRARLKDIHTLIEASATAVAPERHQLLTTIHERIVTLSREIGYIQPNAPPEQIERRFRVVLLEDTTFHPQELALNRRSWEQMLSDLCTVQKLAPILALSTIQHMVANNLAGQFFATMPEDALDDVINYYTRFVSPHLTPFIAHLAHTTELPHQLAGIRTQLAKLKELRETLAAQIARCVQEAAVRGDHQVILDAAEMHNFAAHFPDFLQPPHAFAHFGQLFQEDGRNQMVLNLTWPGPGPAFSRFSYLFSRERGEGSHRSGTRLADLVRTYVTELGQRHSAVYAALSETGGSNANVHDSLTPYEIVLPHNVSNRPGSEQLHLRDLQVLYDSQKGQVRFVSQRLGTIVYPLHMGFSTLDCMPNFYRALTQMASHYADINLIALVEARLSPAEKSRLRHYPRLSLGHVVLNRETWKLPQQDLPRWEAGETNFTYFLKVNRWRVTLGLPREGFSRVYSVAETKTAVVDAIIKQLLGVERETSDIARAEQMDSSRLVSTDTMSVGLNQGTLPASGDMSSEVSFVPAYRFSDTVRKPLYINFDNFLLLTLFDTAVKAVPEGQSLTFEEMLPARDHHFLRRAAQSYPTEFIIEVGT